MRIIQKINNNGFELINDGLEVSKDGYYLLIRVPSLLYNYVLIFDNKEYPLLKMPIDDNIYMAGWIIPKKKINKKFIDFFIRIRSERNILLFNTNRVTINYEKLGEAINDDIEINQNIDKDSFEIQENEYINMISDAPIIKIQDNTINISKDVVKSIKGNQNSDIISFEIERFFNAIDLSDMNISIFFKNADGEAGRSKAINYRFYDEVITFDWLLDDKTTNKEGKLEFFVHIYGTHTNGKKYELNSNIASFIINDSFDITGQMKLQYGDFLDDLEQRISFIETGELNEVDFKNIFGDISENVILQDKFDEIQEQLDNIELSKIVDDVTIKVNDDNKLYVSSMDELIEEMAQINNFDSYLLFPNIGKSNNLYIDTTTNIIYRWDDETVKYYSITVDIQNINIINGGDSIG